MSRIKVIHVRPDTHKMLLKIKRLRRMTIKDLIATWAEHELHPATHTHELSRHAKSRARARRAASHEPPPGGEHHPAVEEISAASAA